MIMNCLVSTDFQSLLSKLYFVCSQSKAVKLIDFGCAVEFKENGVEFGVTSEYMAPEV